MAITPTWNDPDTEEFTAGAVLTAAEMNNILENLAWLGRVGVTGWTDYSGSAAWTGSGSNPTGYTVTMARYARIGSIVFYQAIFTSGSSVGSGDYAWSLPVTAQATGTGSRVVGSGYVYDNTVPGHFVTTMYLPTATTVGAIWDKQSGTGIVGAATPMVWTTSDSIVFHIAYEAA